MPLITGINVDPSDRTDWRDALSDLIRKLTAEFWEIPASYVSCSFPHDPSVPTNPPPIATFKVELLFDRPLKNEILLRPWGDRSPARQQKFSQALGKAMEQFLDNMRGTTDARVEVVMFPVDPNAHGFYMTPERR